MEVTEQEKRESIGSELADIFHRQDAIVQCNEILKFNTPSNADDRFRKMAEEDQKTLRMIESVINSFGIRVEPKLAAVAMAETVLETIADDSVTPLEQLSLYTLLRQNQMLCCHLVHKSAQISQPDIKLALTPLDGVYATFTKQVAELVSFTEIFGVEWITGEKPAGGLTGRLRDAVATVTGAVLSKAAKPTDDMNIMTVLTIEHRKVDALFKEIKSAKSYASAKDLFHQLKADLTAHSIAEEDTVYSTFKKFADAREQMEHSHKEHRELRTALDELTFIENDEVFFYEKIDELEEFVTHHVKEEESKVFDMIKSHSRVGDQIALTRAFLDEKREIQLNIGTETVVSAAAKPKRSDSQIGANV
ncbi:MAG: hemerythrin domain-containing protein [Chitinophagaceae bacterium]|nr:hemerythrin domain-containing protein [Oligoflexus sp.]